MSNISLTSTMKSALLSLQSTQKLYDSTQEKLTSGLKVGSPADDPAAYYAASTLTDQADALETRLDNMDQAVEAISAADNGIESMESLLSSMTAIVENALATDSTDTDSRAALGKKFNDLLIQLSTLADDSAYGGTNLLDNQNITVQMGENYNDSTYTVEGFYVAGLTQNDTDDDGEVSCLDSSSVPESWGTVGAAAVTNYAFALNLIEDPTEVVGISSYGVPVATAEATSANENLATIVASVTAALAVDASDSTAASDIEDQINAALSAANAITGTSGSFSLGTSGDYEYSGTSTDGSTAVLDTLNAMYDLYNSVTDTATAETTLATSQTDLAAASTNGTTLATAMATYIDAAEATDVSDSSAATTIQTQTSYAMSAANIAISSLTSATTSATYTGEFEYDSTSGAYTYSRTDGDASTDAVVNTLNSMLGLQASVTQLATDTTTLTTQETTVSAIDAGDFGIVETTSDGWEVDWTDADTYTTTLQTILEQIEQVDLVLENRSKLLSFDQSTISLREDYTEDFINTLEDGADSLTLADVNEESANLLSLETSQSLAVQAMSLANDQMQNVLRLLE
jgi:flagellin